MNNNKFDDENQIFSNKNNKKNIDAKGAAIDPFQNKVQRGNKLKSN